MHVQTLLRGATAATLAGPAEARAAAAANDPGLQPNWSVGVNGDTIAFSGPDDEWDGTADHTIDAGGRLLTPGYVDPHTHLVYAGDRAFELGLKLAGRSYLEILAAGGGIAHTVGKTRAASQATLVEQTLPRLRRLVASGTTTIESKSGYGLTTESELRMLACNQDLAAASPAAIVSTFLGAHAVPAEYAGRTDAYVELVIDDMLPAVAQQGIARFCDVFVEQGVFTFDHGQAIFAQAKRLGLATRLHADEIVNTEGAQLAAQTGCISADHLLKVSPEGIAAMAEAGTIATLLPTVPMTLMAPQWPSGRAILDAGVPVALASDHNPNNPVTHPNLIAQMGCYLLGLTPAQALTATTWNAACSLGMQDQVGSIEVGKRADIILHTVDDLDHWVYALGERTADVVWASGQTVTP